MIDLYYRKITDEIEKCEERLDILEAEKKVKVEKLEHFEDVYKKAKEAHEKNSEILKELQSSGAFFSTFSIISDFFSGCSCVKIIDFVKSILLISVISIHL